MKDKNIIALVTIIAITLLELTALAKGFNGTILTLAVTCIAGIGGYQYKSLKNGNIRN